MQATTAVLLSMVFAFGAASAEDPGYCRYGEGKRVVTDSFAKCSSFQAYGLMNCCFGCSTLDSNRNTLSVCQSLYELGYGSCSEEAYAAIDAHCPGNYYRYCFCRDGANTSFVPEEFLGENSSVGIPVPFAFVLLCTGSNLLLSVVRDLLNL